jgi:hypothetical protein
MTKEPWDGGGARFTGWDRLSTERQRLNTHDDERYCIHDRLRREDGSVNCPYCKKEASRA